MERREEEDGREGGGGGLQGGRRDTCAGRVGAEESRRVEGTGTGASRARARRGTGTARHRRVEVAAVGVDGEGKDASAGEVLPSTLSEIWGRREEARGRPHMLVGATQFCGAPRMGCATEL